MAGAASSVSSLRSPQSSRAVRRYASAACARIRIRATATQFPGIARASWCLAASLRCDKVGPGTSSRKKVVCSSHKSTIASPLEKLRFEKLLQQCPARSLIEPPEPPHLIECQPQSGHLTVFGLNAIDDRIIQSRASLVVLTIPLFSCTHASANRNNGTVEQRLQSGEKGWETKAKSVSICHGDFILQPSAMQRRGYAPAIRASTLATTLSHRGR
jgi:hypothetical protein